MKITYHHKGNTAVWDEDTGLVTGPEYMVERLMDIWEYHSRPVKLTETGPEAWPNLLSAEGATAAGLVAGFDPTNDEPERWAIPKGAIP